MSKPADTAPSLRYYRANEGRWRAPFVFAITSRRALAQHQLGWLDRLRARLMALVPQLLGAFVIETTVDATGRIGSGEVVHTTAFRSGGCRSTKGSR